MSYSKNQADRVPALKASILVGQIHIRETNVVIYQLVLNAVGGIKKDKGDKY